MANPSGVSMAKSGSSASVGTRGLDASAAAIRASRDAETAADEHAAHLKAAAEHKRAAAASSGESRVAHEQAAQAHEKFAHAARAAELASNAAPTAAGRTARAKQQREIDARIRTSERARSAALSDLHTALTRSRTATAAAEARSPAVAAGIARATAAYRADRGL